MKEFRCTECDIEVEDENLPCPDCGCELFIEEVKNLDEESSYEQWKDDWINNASDFMPKSS